MAEINGRQKFNADKYRKSTDEKNKAIIELRNQKKLNNDLMSENNALRNENAELGKMYEDILKRYENECYHATVLNGNVINLVKLDAYREYVHMQPMDSRVKYINTKLYQSNPAFQFVEIKDGIIQINEKKYKNYLGGII